jgi:hypothetical protein
MSVHWLDPLLKEARFGALRELHEADIKDKDTIVRDIIHSSCRFDESIFFYDGKFFQFSQFGFSMRFFGSKNVDKESKANFLITGFDLNEKSLRNLFTGIEFILYKLVQLAVEPRPHRYNIEKERLSVRFAKLRNSGFLQSVDRDVFDEIVFCRNAFSHSFVEIDAIEYFDIQLALSFDHAKWLSNFQRFGHDEDERPERFFSHDVRDVTNIMINEFRPIQYKQMDVDKLHMLLKKIIPRRKRNGIKKTLEGR